MFLWRRMSIFRRDINSAHVWTHPAAFHSVWLSGLFWSLLDCASAHMWVTVRNMWTMRCDLSQWHQTSEHADTRYGTRKSISSVFISPPSTALIGPTQPPAATEEYGTMEVDNVLHAAQTSESSVSRGFEDKQQQVSNWGRASKEERDLGGLMWRQSEEQLCSRGNSC